MLKSSPLARSGLRILPDRTKTSRRRPAVCAHMFDVQSVNDLLSLDPIILESHVRSSLLTLSDVAAASAPLSVTIADAASSAAAAAAPEAAANTPQDNGWLQPLVGALETTLLFFQSGLTKLNVPYSYGWSIVLLTATVKLLVYPLTKKQVESALAVQKLKPQLDALKARYGDNKDQIQKETSILYKEAGVDPLAGCLPSLATIPIFIGLYRSLTSVASTGLLDDEGFYWIPSLAGPTTMAEQKAGLGSSWLLPFVDGHPPIGWDQASLYLVLPVALLVAQYISIALTSQPIDEKSENATTQKVIMGALPLMIGWFSLNVPAGLSLYYFSNTVLTTAQQVYLKKLGGADVKINLPLWSAGTARRTAAETLEDAELERAIMEGAASIPQLDSDMSAAMGFDDTSAPAVAEASSSQQVMAMASAPALVKRCKRKRTRATIQAAADALGSPIGDVMPSSMASSEETVTAQPQ